MSLELRDISWKEAMRIILVRHLLYEKVRSLGTFSQIEHIHCFCDTIKETKYMLMCFEWKKIVSIDQFGSGIYN